MKQDVLELEIPVGKRTPLYRFFEMLPALLSYTTILLPILLSLISPLAGALFVIVYIIAWFVKAIAMTARSIQGFTMLNKAMAVDWQTRLADLEHPARALKQAGANHTWKNDLHRHNLERLIATENPKKPSDIFHVVIIPTYNEAREVLETTLRAIMASDYAVTQHLMIVLAYEQRGGVEIERTCQALYEQYRGNFLEFYLVQHPENIPNEVVGKGGNITYAGQYVQEKIVSKGLDPENVVVTTLDSDNRPHKTYFAYLTYEYIMHPEPRYTSFQPLSLFLNNIWDVPAPMRVLATGNSFWNIVVSQRPNMLRNFAAHSQSLVALIDMNFWSTRTVVEDGHQFWRSYFRYDGHYAVTPIYVPIYQDAVLSTKYTRTLKAQFVQLRRWAYGASDVAYVADQIINKKSHAPFWDSLSKFIRLIDSHVSWASAPYVLLFGAFAPLFLSSESSRSIVAHQLPNIASDIQQFALVGMAIVIVLSFRMLPERPAGYTWRRNISMLFQWILAPFLGIIYGSSAALNSQTRLLLGKYLDRFDVTEKAIATRPQKDA